MERPRFADGGDGLQVMGVVWNILNKQSLTADKGWPSSLGVRWGLTTKCCTELRIGTSGGLFWTR